MPRRQQKTIYLTFDDGPVPEVTPFVLENLATYRARATFFCVGDNVARYPDIFQQLCAAGHGVGNHTHHHLNGWKTPTLTYLEDVAQCEGVMTSQEHTPQPGRLFRPPYGRVSLPQLRQLRKQYRIIMWDILSGDFDRNFSAACCLEKSIAHSQPGTIIIFHDSYKAFPNLQYVLPRYLEHFASAGYDFAAI
jgi:peptidoglycan/xylan/chitin deacetylase (PgdA/CDA1 family)